MKTAKTIKLSIVVPFHRTSGNLQNSLKTVLSSKFTEYISEIILCHNGPYLDEIQKAKEAIKEFASVSVLHTDSPGLGEGCRIGIAQASATHILITGIDFPFGTTDLANWTSLIEKDQNYDIVIGSKLHPETVITGRSFLRSLSTTVFNLLKRILIPIRLPLDTQGTVFINTAFAKKASALCSEPGFFFTTELITHSIKHGATFTEVPVTYITDETRSSVSPVKDGLIFLKSLIKLRKSLRTRT